MITSPRLFRFILNVYPPYLGTGVWIDRISKDWREIDVSMKLHWYNRNAMKTHFGGSLYSMVDPHLMLMLMQIMGKDYIVWDKAAGIEFIKPGTGKVVVQLRITDDMLAEIHSGLARKKKVTPQYEIDILDESNEVVARIRKTLYVRRRE